MTQESSASSTFDGHLQSDPHARRYEFMQDGALAGFVDYYQFQQVALVVHTEVKIEGKGNGSRLARRALDFFHSQGWHVAPVCGFMAGYMRKHPEFSNLVTPDCMRIFKL